MDDDEWAQLCAPLRRLLCVEDKAFHATSGDVPVATWLVVRLDRMENIRKTKTSREGRMARISSVLHAVTLLYEQGDRSYLPRVAFWTRVVTSEMMQRRVTETEVASVSQALASKPVCLLLDWSNMGMALADICSLLDKILQHSRPAHVSQMTMGLRLSGCRVTSAGLTMLDALWTQHRHAAHALVALDHIGRLDLSGLVLSRASVKALVKLLFNHQVWDLRLDQETLVRYTDVASMQAIVSSAVSARCHSSRASSARPVYLSFSRNTLHARHVQAIADAFETSTRSIGSLSLVKSLSTGLLHGPESCWWWLARVMYRIESPVATTTTDGHREPDAIVELDLSENTVFDCNIVDFRDSLVAMVIDRLGQDNLSCNVKPATKLRARPNRRYAQSVAVIEEGVEYPVQGLHPDGWLRVTQPKEGWLPIEAVAWVRAGNQTCRLCPRFNALVLNNVTTATRRCATIGDLVATVGSSVQRLSARHVTVYPLVRPIVDVCTQLTHLDLHGADVVRQILHMERYSSQPSLRRLRQLTLRTSSRFDFKSLDRFLELHPTVEVVEMAQSILVTVGTQEFARQCRQLVTDRDGRELDTVEVVSISTKYAFLSVPMAQRLAPPLVATVWAFAARRVTRRILWHAPWTQSW